LVGREDLDGATSINPYKMTESRIYRKPPTGTLKPYTGAWGKTQAYHLARRAIIGATKKEMDALAGMTFKNAIASIFNVTAADLKPAPPVVYSKYTESYVRVEILPSTTPKTYTLTQLNTIDDPIPVGQTWVTAKYDPNLSGIENRRFSGLKTWWIGQILESKPTILENMVIFWHNHFATEFADVQEPRYLYKQNTVLRKNALGNFKTFVKEITLDSAMLRYLNGDKNIGTAPDENYARELQELFTIGKGVDSKYTEDDVKAAALVLSGWVTAGGNSLPDNNVIASSFVPSRHWDKNKVVQDKKFSAFYGNKIIKGQAGVNGAKEVDELIDMLLANNEAAKFISRKLYNYFVYYDITADVETNVITPMADIFRSSGYNIQTVVEALLSSEHFYDVNAIGCIIKQPIDHYLGTARAFEFLKTMPQLAGHQLELWYRTVGQFIKPLTDMQQNIGDPPNVAGWPAFYQQPMQHEIWVNSATIAVRETSLTNLVSGFNLNLKFDKDTTVAPTSYNTRFDVITWVKNNVSKPADPNVVINELVDFMYANPLTTVQKDVLKKIYLTKNLANDTYWTQAWNDYLATPTDAVKLKIVKDALEGLSKMHLLKLPEMHLA
jgi:uncharacterized protein (DUF1800 family)